MKIRQLTQEYAIFAEIFYQLSQNILNLINFALRQVRKSLNFSPQR